jgi:type I restriction enzyme, S subunit
MMPGNHKLGDLCAMVRGTSPTMKTEPGDYPLVVTAAHRRSSNTWQLEGPAVCIPLISSTGHGDAALHRVHYQEGKFALANLLVALLPKDPAHCNPKYLYYLLMAKKNELLVPLMSGTANVSLKEVDIAQVAVWLPSPDVQQALVGKLEELERKVSKAKTLQADIARDAADLLAAVFHETTDGTPHRRMEEVAPLVRRPVTIKADQEYPELGVRSFGKGTFHKEPILGRDLGTKRLFHIEPGDVIFNNVFAWEGAVAVAQDDDAGRFGSHRFITCVPQQGAVSASFLCYYFLTPDGLQKLGAASPGGAGRNRTLGLAALANISVPVPDQKKQLRFEDLYRTARSFSRIHAAQTGEIDSLVHSVLSKAFANKL